MPRTIPRVLVYCVQAAIEDTLERCGVLTRTRGRWCDEASGDSSCAIMGSDFVLLKCPHCGGQLEIHNDMDQFYGGYCGMNMLVQRRGGTIILKSVEAAIKRVQVGTDRIAAELELARYQTEHDRLQDIFGNSVLAAIERGEYVGAPD